MITISYSLSCCRFWWSNINCVSKPWFQSKRFKKLNACKRPPRKWRAILKDYIFLYCNLDLYTRMKKYQSYFEFQIVTWIFHAIAQKWEFESTYKEYVCRLFGFSIVYHFCIHCEICCHGMELINCSNKLAIIYNICDPPL